MEEKELHPKSYVIVLLWERNMVYAVQPNFIACYLYKSFQKGFGFWLIVAILATILATSYSRQK